MLTGDGEFSNTILNQLEDPHSELSLWDQEHDEHVARRLLSLIEKDFSSSTWVAFRGSFTGEKVSAIAADLGIFVNAVYLAKSGVLRRLRQELQGLHD